MSAHYTGLGHYEPLETSKDELNDVPDLKYRADSRQGFNLAEQSARHGDGQNTDNRSHGLGRWDKFMHLMNEIWAWELGAVAFSLACLGAVIWLLISLDGDDSQLSWQWTYRLSPNTVLAIFVTMAKSSMLVAVAAGIAQMRWMHYASATQKLAELDDFNEASRGPWGAILFLFGNGVPKGKARIVACAGAVVMILALVMDPFAQQLLRYKLIPVDVTEPGSAWMSAAWTPDSSNKSLLQGDTMRRTFNGGLLKYGEPPQWHCSTGNCTWGAFASFGVHSECMRVEETAKVSCVSGAGVLNKTCTEVEYDVPSVRLPIKLNNGTTSENSTAQGVYTFLKGISSDDYPLGGSDDSVMFQFLVAQMRYDTDPGDAVNMRLNNDTTRWNITACSIRWVAKVYDHLEVVNGILKDTQPTVVHLEKISIRAGNEIEFRAANKTAIPAGYQDQVYRVNLTEGSSEIRRLLMFDYDVLNYPNSRRLDVRGAFSAGMLMYWNVDITDAMLNVTTSFTNLIRSFNPDFTVSGTASRHQVSIDVIWAYFAIPALLILSSVAFLIVVIIICSRRVDEVGKVPLWKTSTVPPLLPPSEGLGRREYIHNGSRTGCAVEAESISVRLRRTAKNRMRFVET